jgi:hypothetical protein
MKKILILLSIIAFQSALQAQIRSQKIDLIDSKINSDREIVVADSQDSSIFIFFQKDREESYPNGKLTLLKVNNGSKILLTKELPPEFPRINNLLTTTTNDSSIFYFYRANKVGKKSKMDGMQLINCIQLDKNMLEPKIKMLFEVNHPQEKFIGFVSKDTVQYLITLDNKAKKVAFYGFDANQLKSKKVYSLPEIIEKKWYEKALNNIGEGTDFETMAQPNKIFMEDNIFHLILDYNKNQYYMSFDPAKDSATHTQMPLALKSSVSYSSNPLEETTGQIIDNKIFQLRHIEEVLSDITQLKN